MVFIDKALGGFLIGEGILIGKEHVSVAVKQAALAAVQSAAHELPVVDEQPHIAAAVVVIVPAAGDDGVGLGGHLACIVKLIAAELIVGKLAPELAFVGNKDLAEGADGAVLILLPDKGEDGLVQIIIDRAAKHVALGIEVQLLTADEPLCRRGLQKRGDLPGIGALAVAARVRYRTGFVRPQGIVQRGHRERGGAFRIPGALGKLLRRHERCSVEHPLPLFKREGDRQALCAAIILRAGKPCAQGGVVQCFVNLRQDGAVGGVEV